MKTLPELKITVQNATEEIFKLLHVIKPSWIREQVELKKVAGGFSCLMYMCFNKDDSTEGVTVRARTNVFQDFPHVRESAFEAKILQTLHTKGMFPAVLATFQNGYCYSYIPGTPLYSFMNLSFSIDDVKLRLMARGLAEIHSIKVEGCNYTTTSYFKNMYTVLNEKYPTGDKLPEGSPARAELERELKMVEKQAVQLGSPFILCHGDPHPGNVVYDKEKGIATYVDWELTHIGYQAADIAYALQVFKLLELNPALKMDITENIERKYIKYYLEKWFEIQGKKDCDVTEEDVDKLALQASVFKLSCLLFWVIVLLSQFAVGAPDHIDYEAYKDAIASCAKLSLDDNQGRDKDSPSVPEAAPEDQTPQWVNTMYSNYLKMKDGILSKFNKS